MAFGFPIRPGKTERRSYSFFILLQPVGEIAPQDVIRMTSSIQPASQLVFLLFSDQCCKRSGK